MYQPSSYVVKTGHIYFGLPRMIRIVQNKSLNYINCRTLFSSPNNENDGQGSIYRFTELLAVKILIKHLNYSFLFAYLIVIGNINKQ